MKKYVNIIVIVSLALFFTACSNKKVEVDLRESDQMKVYEYKETDNIAERIDIKEFVIDVPEDGYVNTYFIYDDILYYSLNFSSFYENQIGENNIPDFKKEHNTQIRSYHLENKSDRLVYQYDEEKCIEITDLQSNGSVLVWEEYNNEEVWSVKKLDINSKNIPETIISYDQNNGIMNTITPRITADSLYWYEQNNDETHPITLLKYNFETNKITVVRKGLDLTSPFERVSIINNNYATYEINEDNETLIHIENFNKKDEIQLKIKDRISNPINNGKICVWKMGYDEMDRSGIFIYHIKEKIFEKIECYQVFSHGLLEELIFVNQKKGLYCYDVKNKEFQCLVPTDEVSYSFTSLGLQNNVFMSKYRTSIHIINITEK